MMNVPLEICTLVFDELKAENALASLSACAQATSVFTTLCQRRIFNSIHITVHKGTREQARQLAELLQLFQQQPDLARYVKSVKITLAHWMPIACIEPVLDIFHHLFNVEAVHLSFPPVSSDMLLAHDGQFTNVLTHTILSVATVYWGITVPKMTISTNYNYPDWSTDEHLIDGYLQAEGEAQTAPRPVASQRMKDSDATHLQLESQFLHPAVWRGCIHFGVDKLENVQTLDLLLDQQKQVNTARGVDVEVYMPAAIATLPKLRSLSIKRHERAHGDLTFDKVFPKIPAAPVYRTLTHLVIRDCKNMCYELTWLDPYTGFVEALERFPRNNALQVVEFSGSYLVDENTLDEDQYMEAPWEKPIDVLTKDNFPALESVKLRFRFWYGARDDFGYVKDDPSRSGEEDVERPGDFDHSVFMWEDEVMREEEYMEVDMPPVVKTLAHKVQSYAWDKSWDVAVIYPDRG